MQLRSTSLTVALAALMSVAPIASPQASVPSVSLDRLMSAADRSATGGPELAPIQRAALERWLADYTVKVMKYARQGTTSDLSEYLGPSGGHWIESNSYDGAIIVLEDGSVWEVNAIDRIDTALWLPVTDVTVLKARNPEGDYRHVLVNKDDGEKALVKYLGRQ